MGGSGGVGGVPIVSFFFFYLYLKVISTNLLCLVCSELPLFQGLSFPTISSTGPNASIIHYQPTAEKNSVIRKDQIYLCDSGAQYLDGTTEWVFSLWNLETEGGYSWLIWVL